MNFKYVSLLVFSLAAFAAYSCNDSKNVTAANVQDTVAINTVMDTSAYATLAGAGSLQISANESQIYDSMLGALNLDTAYPKPLIMDSTQGAMLDTVSLQALLIAPDTIAFAGGLRTNSATAKLLNEVIKNYITLNAHPVDLTQYNLNLGYPYWYLKTTTRDSIFSQNVAGLNSRWNSFRNQFPLSGGYHTLSRIAFSPDSTWAIVSSGHSCGSLCGEWFTLILQKREGLWCYMGTFRHAVS